MNKLILKLVREQTLENEELRWLLENNTVEIRRELSEKASEVAKKTFGNGVYTRGLIEFTNYCKNDCYYCGIRKSNEKVHRYRLDEEQILKCCENGYELGFKTFVLQGGEDKHFNDERMVFLVQEIKQKYPNCAITLSLGEKSRESYQKLFDAGQIGRAHV